MQENNRDDKTDVISQFEQINTFNKAKKLVVPLNNRICIWKVFLREAPELQQGQRSK